MFTKTDKIKFQGAGIILCIKLVDITQSSLEH